MQDVTVNSSHVYWPLLGLGEDDARGSGRAGIDGSAVEQDWQSIDEGGELGVDSGGADDRHVHFVMSDSSAGGSKGYNGRVGVDGTDLITKQRLGLSLSTGP